MRSWLVVLGTCGPLLGQDVADPNPLDPAEPGGSPVEAPALPFDWNARAFLDLLRGEDDASDVRQLRLQVRSNTSEDWHVRGQLELTDIENPALELFGEVRVLDAAWLRAGHFREPFGIEAHTPLPSVAFPERAAPSQIFAPGRNHGVQVDGGDDLRWAVGFFEEQRRVFSSAGPEQATTARVWGSWQPQADERVHLGLSMSERRARSGALRFRADRGTRLVPEVLDTGPLAGATARFLGLEAAWQHGSTRWQAEWMGGEVEGVGTDEAFLQGLVLTVAHVWTGEARAYNARKGGWSRITPHGRGPAYELAGRASWTDLTDRGVNGGELIDLDVGLNVHVTEHSQVQIHWLHSDGPGIEPFNGLVVRLQVGV